MPRAAPAGAHPAARLIFFARATSVEWEIHYSKRSLDRDMLADRQSWQKFLPALGATRIRDGLVFSYVEDEMGCQSTKSCRWRVVICALLAIFRRAVAGNSEYCPDAAGFLGAWDDFC